MLATNRIAGVALEMNLKESNYTLPKVRIFNQNTFTWLRYKFSPKVDGYTCIVSKAEWDFMKDFG